MCVTQNTHSYFSMTDKYRKKWMTISLSQYVKSVCTFDKVECNLIISSSNPLRSKSCTEITALTQSIREHGLLEPIIVRPKGDKFEVVAGNRRLEACKLLRHKKINCMVFDLDDKSAFEISLTENLQRKTLNPIEEAKAFKKYCNEFGWGGQSELAKKVGKSQEYISHRIKLLDLPLCVMEALEESRLTLTAAQELLWLGNENLQEEVMDMITRERLDSAAVRKVISALKSRDDDDCQPDFILQKPNKRSETQRESQELVSESIMILRIAMVRLDNIISKIEDEYFRERILRERSALHDQIDELIRLKGSNGNPRIALEETLLN